MRNITVHRDPEAIMDDFAQVEVGGFTFWFSYSLAPNGILVDPATANVEDNRWLSAFKRALEVHPIWIVAGRLSEFYDSLDEGDLSRLDTDMLTNRRDDLAFVLEHERTGNIGLPPLIFVRFLGLHSDIIGELARRAAPVEVYTRTKTGQPNRPVIAGYVYLIQSPTGAYKIGRTKNPDNRLKTFHVKLPFEVEYVAVISTPDMYSLESDMHKRYADKRVNGEWFMLDAADVEAIKAMAVQS